MTFSASSLPAATEAPFKIAEGQSSPPVAMAVMATPFEQASRDSEAGAQGATGLAAHLAAINLGDYASLRAEQTVWPEWAEQISARYGVRDTAERAALDDHWRARIEQDPNVKDAFDRTYAHFVRLGQEKKASGGS